MNCEFHYFLSSELAIFITSTDISDKLILFSSTLYSLTCRKGSHSALKKEVDSKGIRMYKTFKLKNKVTFKESTSERKKTIQIKTGEHLNVIFQVVHCCTVHSLCSVLKLLIYL